MTRENDLRRLISRHQRRLSKLKEQRAITGSKTEPDTLIEIEDLEGEIDGLLGEMAQMKEREKAIKEEFDNFPDSLRSLADVLLLIHDRVSDLQVTDPRLEILRGQLLDLSVMVDQLQQRLETLEQHEKTGLNIARSVLILVGALVLSLMVRFI